MEKDKIQYVCIKYVHYADCHHYSPTANTSFTIFTLNKEK